jgi:ligand-binding SRPBCC domain-containing protein
MSALHVTNFIAAPAEIVFDLSRHILLQKKAMEKIGVRQVRGVSSGLRSLGDAVMWSLSVLTKTFFFSLKISACTPNDQIAEEMFKSPLLSFKHVRHLKAIKNGTLVIDEIQYELPNKWWAAWVDKFFLRKKINELLHARNKVLKEYAESNKWRALLTK